MRTFFVEYLLFLAKSGTMVFMAIIALLFIGALKHRSQSDASGGKLKIRCINDHYQHYKDSMAEAVLKTRKDRKQWRREQKQLQKKHDRQTERSRIYLLDFHGDVRASAVTQLREELSAVMTMARPNDEVVLRLESGGGMVHAYGLAASQLLRLRERDIPLTVIVDRIAASGGYMMAAVANRIVAAPFAVVGSIGVVAQMPNLNRWLKERNIDYELHTAGPYKRTLTMLGENTPEARDKFQQELEETHELFKMFIARLRPQINLEQIATGEHWYGEQAISKDLVDELSSSDDYLWRRSQEADIYHVHFHQPIKSLRERFLNL